MCDNHNSSTPTRWLNLARLVAHHVGLTSPQYQQWLRDVQVQISMDSKGRALDNIFTERLWRTVKYEELYVHDYASPREARQQLSDYFEFYNHKRLHQALDYLTPVKVYSTATP